MEEKFRQAAQSFIDEAVKQELSEQIANSVEFNDRLVLYFTQNGRDMYTGRKLNIENLSQYHIDHILPQSLIKDDSLDNRALTDSVVNTEMSNQFVSERFGSEQRAFWQQLKNNGMISGRKFRNLVMCPDEIDKYATGFINRQLVETRQIIKTVEQIIHRLWPDIQIVTVKANLTHQVRSELDFPKIRNLNDYHHAFDALLAARIGQYLLEHYAGLKSFFTYGEFQRGETKKYGTMNFLSRLTKFNTDDNGELLPEVKSWIDSIESIYNYKKVSVVWETTTNAGALFDQTVYPRPDRDTSKRKLIPTKLDKPTDIYGGYTSAKTAYMAVMRVENKNGVEYPVFNIPVSIATQLNYITDKQALKQQVKHFIVGAEQSAGKRKLYEAGDVVLPRVALGQLFEDQNYGQIYLISNTEVQNPQSLWLNRSNQQQLIHDPEGEEKPLEDIYQQILSQIDRYFLAFNIRQQRQKLLGTLDQFASLPVGRVNEQARTDQNQRSVITRVMVVLGKGSREEKFPEFGLSALGRLLTGQVVLGHDSQIIYQSPTGLFERRVALKDL